MRRYRIKNVNPLKDGKNAKSFYWVNSGYLDFSLETPFEDYLENISLVLDHNLQTLM